MGLTIVPAPVVASVSLQETQITSSSTFTVPTGVTKVWAHVYGGGGGGASPGASNRLGTPGIAGATVVQQLTVTPGAGITATIGAGGAGGGQYGYTGTATVFGSITSAPGGDISGWYVGSVSLSGLRTPGASSFGASANNGAAPANSAAGGGQSRYGGGFAGGSGRIIVRYLA
jgi:hypothetical protein